MRSFILSAAFLTLASTLVACGGTEPTDDPIVAAASSQLVQGRVESASDSSPQVAAYQLRANGQMTPVSTESATVDAEGRYELAIDVTDPSAGPIVVQASLGGEAQGSVLLSAYDAAVTVVVAAPIDLESTAEAEVAASVQAELSITLDAGDLATLELLVDDQVAAALSASGAHGSDVQAIADGVIAAAAAFEAALAAEGAGSVSAAETKLVTAQAQLAIALDAATSEAAVEAAIAFYAEAFVDAYVDAGFEAGALAAAAHAAIEASTAYAAGASESVQAAAAAQAHATLAALVTWQVEAQAETAGLGAEAQSELAAAGEALVASAASAATLGAEASASLESSWQTYAASVEATVQAHVDTATFVALQSVAEGLAVAESTLDAQLAAAAGTAVEVGMAMGEAHVDFYAEVGAASSVGIVTATGPSEVEATALITLIAEATLAD